MRSCEDKLKGKNAHFRLPSASQKRACLSSLILETLSIDDENGRRVRTGSNFEP